MPPESAIEPPDPAPLPHTDPRVALRLQRRERRRRVMRVVAVVAFVALLVFAPLSEKAPLEKMYTLVIVCCTALALLFASARLSFALMLPTVVFGLLKAASMLKFEYLLTPVLAPDLEYYINRDTLELIGRYPILLGFTLGMSALVPLLLVPSWVWETTRGWTRPGRLRAGVLRTLGTISAVAVLAACVVPAGPFLGVFNKPMWATVTDRSFLTAFFTSFSDTGVRLPELTGKVDRTINWKLDKPLRAPQHRPDVFAVLEESTFDPRMLKACTLPVCTVPMFVPDAYTRANGALTVHTFGGGTWTSEFALHTGLADVLFGNAGLYAPYNLAPRVAHTLPDAFKSAGYRVIAVYSHSGEFLNARNAYADYGFDAFYDGTDQGLGWKSTDADLFAVLSKIYLEEAAANPDRPLFVFTLTLHQHGPHMKPLATLAPPFDKPLFPGTFTPGALDDWLNLNLGNYLERVHDSSKMLDDLQALLWKSGRPTVLMHFGDHQPSFDGAMHSIPKRIPDAAGPNSSRVTYYMLRTSFPMAPMPKYESLDIVYLGSLLLDAAGVPKDAFYQANTLLRDRCKGRYLQCADTALLTSYHDYIFNVLKDLRE